MFLILCTVNDLVKEEHLPMHNHLKGKYLTPFLESQDTQLSPSTIYSKQLYVGQLLDYLEARSVESFGDFDINLVYEFINTRSEWAPSTVSSAQFHIRSFFDFLFNQGIIQFDGRKVFPVILTNKRARIIVNSGMRATPARTFSHGVTGFQPRRHGAETQWSEGLSGPSELFFRCCSSGQ